MHGREQYYAAHPGRLSVVGVPGPERLWRRQTDPYFIFVQRPPFTRRSRIGGRE
jgi:hypothetical protein